jgi:hypothetical protein
MLMKQTITYLDPTAQAAAPQDAYKPRLEIGASPRIALFPNLFTDSAAFLHDLSRPLSRLFPGASFPYFDKQFGRNMSVPASPVLKARILAESDAVVLAYGHCGSCTAGVTHDGVALARAGKPVAILVTKRFREEALFLARALGLPAVPFVFLPHPVAGEDAAMHYALAEAVAPWVVAALLEGKSTDASEILEADGTGLAVVAS